MIDVDTQAQDGAVTPGAGRNPWLWPLRAEFVRLLRLWFPRVAAGLVILTSFVIMTTLAASSGTPTDAELAAARSEYKLALGQYERFIESCDDGTLPKEACENIGPPPKESDFLPYAFSFSEQAENMLYLGALVTCVFGFAIGASFVGGEWSSGGMMNLLLWHPRRRVVLATKLCVAVLGVLAFSVAYLVLWMGFGAGVGATIGTIGYVSDSQARWLALLALRVLALVAAATVAGFTLASLGRKTAAAPAGAVGYLVCYETGLLAIGGGVGSNPEEVRLTHHIGTWITGGWGGSRCGDRGRCFFDGSLSDCLTSGLVLALVVAALISAALLAIQRRDVT